MTKCESFTGYDLSLCSHGVLGSGTIYVYLSRLEEKGLIHSEESMEGRGRGTLPRRRYQITKSGQDTILRLNVRFSDYSLPWIKWHVWRFGYAPEATKNEAPWFFDERGHWQQIRGSAYFLIRGNYLKRWERLTRKATA